VMLRHLNLTLELAGTPSLVRFASCYCHSSKWLRIIE
jgi:hypothetical protein